MNFPLALLLIVVGLLPVASAAARPSDQPCGSSRFGTTTLASNAQARVYRAGRERFNRGEAVSGVFACYRGYRPVALDGDNDGNSGTDGVFTAPIRLAGRYASYATEGGIGDTLLADLRVVDLKSRKKWVVGGTSGDYCTFFDLELTRARDVAWIERCEDSEDSSVSPVRVVLRTARGRLRVLDSGPAIGRRSLARSGSRLYWMRGDTRRVAPIR